MQVRSPYTMYFWMRPPFTRTVDMTQQSQSALSEGTYWKGYAQHMTDASQVVVVGWSLLPATCSLCHFATQHCAGNACIANSAICGSTYNIELVNTRAVRREPIEGALPVILSIYLSIERLSVMVDPRYVN